MKNLKLKLNFYAREEIAMLKLAKLGIFVLLLIGFAIHVDVAIAQTSADDSNIVTLSSRGGIGDKICRESKKGSCVKIQSRNNDRNEWRDAPEYNCASNIGASGYRVVCGGGGGQVTIPRESGITKSGLVAGTAEKKEVVCVVSTGSWSQTDPVNNEGCGRITKHICPDNRDVIENKVCSVRIVNFETTSCSSCLNKCVTTGKSMGSCFSQDILPFDADRVRRFFFVGGNYGCNVGQGCYCYSSEDIPADRVNLVSSGTCASDTPAGTSPDESAKIATPETETITPSQTVANNVAINGQCSNDPQCESGFCDETASKCVDECHTRSLSKCQDNKCALKGNPDLPGVVCINKIGENKLIGEMAKLLPTYPVEIRVAALTNAKKIMEDYNINYGEYLAGWERFRSGIGVSISRPTFSRKTGFAVKINTATDGCPDFVSTGASSGKVDYDDFFKFVDEFGKSVNRNNEKFDLERDQYNIIGFGDFFKFADNFGKEVQCFTATCTDNEANLPGEMIFGSGNNKYSCGGECGLCNYDRLKEVGVNGLNILSKNGDCQDGVCTFKLKASGKYSGIDKLNIKFKGSNYNDKSYDLRFSGAASSSSTPAGFSVLDVTSSTVEDLSELKDSTILNTLQAPGGKSRFECGLQLNPGFCCPAGYQTSSDGSRCVLTESETSYCADFNSDNRVDFVDYFYVADNFGAESGESGYDSKVDLDKSGKIDFDDFFLFADEFGKEPKC
ncbi:MAG: hypothetical protein HY361_01485 [Candidatus Aenigmarchaeota archaeon]|nr:hypothetical protein [Candidatus Aenigmarchaeota archaeon]